MNPKRAVAVSKFLSLVLRHIPEKVSVSLDAAGWVGVEELLAGCAAHGFAVSRAELETVVASSDKQRFVLSVDGLRIRANQGHSVSVDLGLAPVRPPELLYHGTVDAFLPSIRGSGLEKRSRHHVHLSPDRETALKVGARRGKPVVLEVHSGKMHEDGILFYQSLNRVWLTDHVPPQYLRFP